MAISATAIYIAEHPLIKYSDYLRLKAIDPEYDINDRIGVVPDDMWTVIEGYVLGVDE